MKKKSPIKNKPLRQAGESLREQINDQIDDKILPWIMAALVAWMLVGFELLRKLHPQPPRPGSFAGLAALFSLFVGIRIWREIPILRQRRRGLEGEKAVGQLLERLRVQGYEVFHDIPGDGFNLDHVVVGPGGVFSVETKTIFKPEKGQTKIRYDGAHIEINGFVPDRDPLIQARAQAGWLRKLLQDATGKPFFIRPVVLYPGWFVEGSSWTVDVWVLNEQAFPKFLDNAPVSLTGLEVRMIADALARHVRAC